MQPIMTQQVVDENRVVYPVWYPNPQWIDINPNSENTISELFRDSGNNAISYSCVTADNTPYHVKIEGGADGTTVLYESDVPSGAVFRYDLVIGEGKPCVHGDERYYTYRFTTTGNITSFQRVPTTYGYEYEVGLLWSIWKIPAITTDDSNFQSKPTTNGGNAAYFSLLQYIDMPYLKTITGIFCSYCMRLTGFNLPALESTAAATFSQMQNLEMIYLPSLLTLNVTAFTNCFNLQVIDCPNLTVLSNNAISAANRVRRIHLPKITTNPSNLISTGKTVLEEVELQSMTTYSFSVLPTGVRVLKLPRVVTLTNQLSGFKNLRLLDLSGLQSFAATSSGYKLVTGCRIDQLLLSSLETLSVEYANGSCIDNCSINNLYVPKLKTINSMSAPADPINSATTATYGPFYNTVIGKADFSSLEEVENTTFLKATFDLPPSFPALKRVKGKVGFNQVKGLNGIVFPSLEEVGDFFMNDVWDVERSSFPALIYAGQYLLARYYNTTYISLPSLETIGTRALWDNSQMSNLATPSLKHMVDGVFSFMTGMTSFDFTGVDIQEPVDMVSCFSQIPLLQQLDLRGFNMNRFKVGGTGTGLDARTYRVPMNVNIPGFETSLLLPTKPGQWTGAAPQVVINYTGMTAAQLNALFTYMPADQVNGKTWDVRFNTGSSGCDPTILEAKGATVLR